VKYTVKLVSAARQDLVEIYRYIAAHDGDFRAGQVLDGLEEAAQSLQFHPRRGHIPAELEGIGAEGILEIHFKPYRIVYRLRGNEVLILVAADGRRNFKDLLSKRLLL
jgi:toxin ParE1/3/4